MREHELCAFIADGSILPRENRTSALMREAVPFVSPEETAVWISLEDGQAMRGMGSRKGVTVIKAEDISGNPPFWMLWKQGFITIFRETDVNLYWLRTVL